MTKQQKSERDEFIAKLRETLKPGDTLHTVLKSVSRTGMSRVIDVFHFYVDKDTGKVRKSWLSYWIAKATGMSFQDGAGKPEGIKIGGCGMDMGFEIVYTLGRTLYPDGFGEDCQLCHKRPTTKEQALAGSSTPKTTSCPVIAPFIHKYRGRNGDTTGWDNDGGYAFKQEWI